MPEDGIYRCLTASQKDAMISGGKRESGVFVSGSDTTFLWAKALA